MFLHSSKRAFASSRLTMGVLLRGMAFLLAGKPSGRTTLTVIDGTVHAGLPKTHDELSSKTIHNMVTLLRTMLVFCL
jgi:hypothetical protein